MLVFWFAFVSLRRALATPSLRLGHGRQFTVEDDRFVKDGAPFVLRSGSVHYSRVPRAYWRDRLRARPRARAQRVTTYVPWNLHETEPNAFDFAGAKHVGAFLDEAKDAGLLAILRVGPYMCGEWEFGGFPASETASIRGRQRRVVIQLENEFGDYGDCSKNENDARYMRHLYDLATQYLGTDVIYSTVSPARNLDKRRRGARDFARARDARALYAPAPFLNSGKNDVIVLDLDGKQPPALQSRASQRWAS
ncbi:beta-galactosidase [Aureococcus anophagefferens]|uniref:Beta-galactosidase n=1 Tax=Aureococcus anophagefferens TaxID=44056 RepID=A0ABR1FLG0_AURAN